MKPFARINLSSVLSSASSSVALAKEEALAKGDALRRGRGKCENVKMVPITKSNNQYPVEERR